MTLMEGRYERDCHFPVGSKNNMPYICGKPKHSRDYCVDCHEVMYKRGSNAKTEKEKVSQ